MINQDVKVRFAPSPTGFLHLGNARTAVFNWLHARHVGGRLVLRVEDTDRERSTDEAEQVIFDALGWLGIDWDEGPFRQSERSAIYREHVERLLDAGRAYRCYCTPDELEARRKAAIEAKNPFIGYDGRCRDRREPRTGVAPVVRFRSPDDGHTTWVDLNQGKISVNNAETDDLILMRADGTFTYNFTVVVDDHTMGITHVIRGADHITNTPRQIQMYEAFGFPVPVFAHHGLVLGPDKSKLSKRHGAVSVLQYRDLGFLPEALVNALARLGWSHGDQEIFSPDELVRLFDVKDVSPGAAIFDFEKLRSLFNQEHILRADSDRLSGFVQSGLGRLGVALDASDPRLGWAVEAGRKRGKTLVEMAELLMPFFRDEIPMSPKAEAKHLKPEAKASLEAIHARLSALETWTPESLMQAFNAAAESLGVGLGKVAQPVRVAITGSDASPPIDLVAAIIGRRNVLARLEAALAKMGTPREP